MGEELGGWNCKVDGIRCVGVHLKEGAGRWKEYSRGLEQQGECKAGWINHDACKGDKAQKAQLIRRVGETQQRGWKSKEGETRWVAGGMLCW